MYTLSKINPKHTKSVFERLSHFTNILRERICKIMKPAGDVPNMARVNKLFSFWGFTNLNIDKIEHIHLVKAKCV